MGDFVVGKPTSQYQTSQYPLKEWCPLLQQSVRDLLNLCLGALMLFCRLNTLLGNLMLFFLYLVPILYSPANISGDSDVLFSLGSCLILLWPNCWLIDLPAEKNHTLFMEYGLKQNPLWSNMRIYIHTYTTIAALFSPLSVLLNTRRQTHAQKDGR